MDTQQVLVDNSNILSTMSNFIISCFRILGWWITKGLYWLTNTLENATGEIFKNIDFFNSKDVGLAENSQGGLYNNLILIFGGVLTVGLIVVFLLMMTGRIKNGGGTLIWNIVLAISLVVGLPSIYQLVNSVTQPAIGFFSGDKTNLSQQVLADNVYDLTYLDENNFSAQSKEQKNNFGQDAQIENIVDPTELIKPSKMTNKDVFENKLVYDKDGNVSLEKASKDSMLSDMLASQYYRYKIDWGTIFFTLAILTIVFVVSSIKGASLIFNLAYTGLFGVGVAGLDLTTGQRIKKVFTEIIGIFVVFISISFSLQLFVLSTKWVNTLDISIIAKLLMYAGFGFAVINGPNIVQQILGIDAGVGGEMQQIASTAYTANTFGNMLKGIASKAGSVGAKVGGSAITGGAMLGAAGAGSVAGAFGKFQTEKGNNNNNQSSSDNQQNNNQSVTNMSAQDGQSSGSSDTNLQTGSIDKDTLGGTANGNQEGSPKEGQNNTTGAENIPTNMPNQNINDTNTPASMEENGSQVSGIGQELDNNANMDTQSSGGIDLDSKGNVEGIGSSVTDNGNAVNTPSDSTNIQANNTADSSNMPPLSNTIPQHIKKAFSSTPLSTGLSSFNAKVSSAYRAGVATTNPYARMQNQDTPSTSQQAPSQNNQVNKTVTPRQSVYIKEPPKNNPPKS